MAWQPSYATAADLASWLGVDNTDPQLALATEAASRVIDQACNRQFGLLSSSEFRWYTAEWDRRLRRWIIDIDDVQTNLVVEVDNDTDGTPEAEIVSGDYILTPDNAAVEGRPWWRIEVLPKSPVKPNGLRRGVKVTARFGWTSIPDSIKTAVLIQASRFYERRQNIAGPLTSKRVDDTQYDWGAKASTTDLDPDVLAMIAPYRRIWAAV